MANKLKDWLFPTNKKSEYTTTSVEVASSEIKEEDEKSINKIQVQAPPRIIKLSEFNLAQNVADDLLDGKSVIVDLTEAEIDVARRIIDFLNGVTYSLDGKVEKVAKLVYLFAPTK